MEENISKKFCKRCHKELKDERSKELGFGKVCYQKYLKTKRHSLFKLEVTNETSKETRI